MLKISKGLTKIMLSESLEEGEGEEAYSRFFLFFAETGVWKMNMPPSPLRLWLPKIYFWALVVDVRYRHRGNLAS